MTPQELEREYAYQYRQYRRLWRKFLAARERYNANPTPELASEKVRIILRHQAMQADLITLAKRLRADDPQARKHLQRQLDVINSTKGQEQERELYECLNDAGVTDLNAIKVALAVKYHDGMKAKQQNSENGKLHKGHTEMKPIMVQAWHDWRANPDKPVTIEGKEYPIAGISSNKQGTGFDDVLAKVCTVSARTIENWRREAGLTK